MCLVNCPDLEVIYFCGSYSIHAQEFNVLTQLTVQAILNVASHSWKEPQFPLQVCVGLLMVYTLVYYFLAKFLLIGQMAEN